MVLRALLDANVLHSIALCDLFIRLALKGLFVPLWSDEILAETQRSILRRRPDPSARALAARVMAMREALPEALVVGYEKRLAAVAALELDVVRRRHADDDDHFQRADHVAQGRS